VQAAYGGDENPICISLSSKSLDMSWEKEGDVLHELLSDSVIVACNLKGTQHLIKEALVHVNWYELEEMLIKQWENLIPHVLLDLSLDASMTRHFEEAGLPLVEVIEGCCHVNSSSPQAKFCETLGLELRSGRAKAAFENPSKVHFSCCVDSC